MEHALLFISLACFFGICMTWSVGANDLANVMSTAMGSKAITVKQAIISAIIFEFAGALLGGSDVAETVRSGIINTHVLDNDPVLVIYGMLAALLASTSWMTLASYLGMPVSVTQAIVGSIIGFGALALGVNAVHWNQVLYICISWVTSPLLAGIIAYLLFLSVQLLILGALDPLRNAKRYIPLYLFLIGFVLSAITLLKAFEHMGILLTIFQKIMVATLSGLIILFFGNFVIQQTVLKKRTDRQSTFRVIEKKFGVLTVLTTCAMVFAHGSNDVAIAVGPIAAVISIAKVTALDHNGKLLFWVLTVGCTGVVAGLLMYGRKVITTVGSSITALTPSRAYCATIAAATVVVASTSTGIPVSATQTLVGAVLGVGLARGIGALDLRVIRNIFMSWAVTIPVCALLSTALFYLAKHLFS